MGRCLEGANLIYSLWPYYLKDECFQWFQDWLEKHQIPLTHCHTSGHAPVADLKRLAKAISAKRLVPIHSFEPDSYPNFFENVELKNNGETCLHDGLRRRTPWQRTFWTKNP